MPPNNDPSGAGLPPANEPASIQSHSRWKRGAAMVWVIILCLAAGGAGLALAQVFSPPTPARTIYTSISGY